MKFNGGRQFGHRALTILRRIGLLIWCNQHCGIEHADLAQMPLAEDDEFIQAFQLDRLNEKRALAIPIRARHRQVFTIRFEAVGDDIPTQ